MRQVVLDTETTGLEHKAGHRIIEIGCVELVGRKLTGRQYHQYINPQREVDQGAMEVHGITNEFLHDKPYFEQIAEDFLEFIDGAQLVIHNAPFDVGFLDAELGRLKPKVSKIDERCSVLDTLILARTKHPGQKNNLDALCKRYHIDNSQRDLHGALLDAEILSDVYLAMTGGQTRLAFAGSEQNDGTNASFGDQIKRVRGRAGGRVIYATSQELDAHKAKLGVIAKASGDKVLWVSSDS